MAIPVVGDGEYLGAGNSNETLRIGKATQAVVVGDSGAAPVTIGGASAGKVGFYGTTPVVRRAYSAAVHNTTGLATSASFGATQLAALQEIQLTLIGLGVWATV
jgi:hypothetical protein